MPSLCEGIDDMRGPAESEMDQHAVPTFLLPLTWSQMRESGLV